MVGAQMLVHRLHPASLRCVRLDQVGGARCESSAIRTLKSFLGRRAGSATGRAFPCSSIGRASDC